MSLPLRGIKVRVGSYKSDKLGYSSDIVRFKAVVFSISMLKIKKMCGEMCGG